MVSASMPRAATSSRVRWMIRARRSRMRGLWRRLRVFFALFIRVATFLGLLLLSSITHLCAGMPGAGAAWACVRDDHRGCSRHVASDLAVTAIDKQLGAGHVLRIVRRKEHRRGRDLVRLAQAAH